MSRKVLAIAGAVVLILGACFHSFGWTIVGAKFAGPLFVVSRTIWFLLPIDWLVVAAIWIQGARGQASVTTMRIAAVIPVAMMVLGFASLGLTFLGAWIMLVAAALGIAATFAKA